MQINQLNDPRKIGFSWESNPGILHAWQVPYLLDYWLHPLSAQ